jgi:hypothetical protein
VNEIKNKNDREKEVGIRYNLFMNQSFERYLDEFKRTTGIKGPFEDRPKILF